MEACLVPVLQPGQVVILDNATFHKGGRIQHAVIFGQMLCPKKQQLIEQAGAQLLYLPPYSPDLNKIENCLSWLKSRVRKHLALFACLRDAIEHVLRLAS